MERRILPSPLLYLSAFFEATRRDYYDALQGAHANGAWHDWLVYFLNGVARQSEDALSRSQRINRMLAEWRERLAGTTSRNPWQLLDHLAANPYVTTNGAARQLKVAFTTAQRAISRLEDEGIVERVGEARRDRVYCARPLLAILEEPAKLSP